MRDRFICRREGHQPAVTVTACPPVVESYITSCQRCGRLIEVDVRTGLARQA